MIYISLTKSFYKNEILLLHKGLITTNPKSNSQRVLYIIHTLDCTKNQSHLN